MLISLFIYLSLELKESELPVCDQVREVIHFRSEVIRKKIAPNSSYCIRGYNIDPYKGNLAFVFNKLSGLEPVIYYLNTGTDFWTEVRGKPEDGGAATGRHLGFLYIKNNGAEKAEINVAYTTFFNDCDDYYISSDPRDRTTLTYKDIGKRHCYFNGINGRQKIKFYSNNTKCRCKGLVYPKAPALASTYSGNLKFTNDQGSIQFMMYVCEERFRKSTNYLEVKADEDNDGYVSSNVNQNEGKFYSKMHDTSDLALILGLSIGIPAGLIVIIIIVLFISFTHCCHERCDWGEFCECFFDVVCCFGCKCLKCSCKCDIIPNGLGEKIIKDYSYSDDVPEYVPEFKEPLVSSF